ncbi:hypothetical protein, partial [Photobacterium swingsii]|uniref:hypothetical protein n=1 Tax=Photobacterium swingsii TaxID=680026 RepID=UPI0040681E50
VERNLAKVEVTSSNLVCRSKLNLMTEVVRKSETQVKLVEHNLAKVEVTPSSSKIGNLVCRSTFSL